MAKKEMTYDEAIAQIEEIMTKFRTSTISIDELSEEVARATKLISYCKERLHKAEGELKKVLGE